MEHELKTWKPYWDAIRRGEKTFELRYNDRGYQTGDVLLLKRWSQMHNCAMEPYTPLKVCVIYILHGEQFGLKDGWVCMAITFPERDQTRAGQQAIDELAALTGQDVTSRCLVAGGGWQVMVAGVSAGGATQAEAAAACRALVEGTK
jgi:hypothetical protein